MQCTKYRANHVFIPGGQPEFTYVAREHRNLESRLLAVLDHLCKLVTLTGPTKSGKSVLAARVLKGHDPIVVDGGSVRREEDLWEQVVERLGGFTSTTRSRTEGIDREVGLETAAQGKFPFLGEIGAKFTAKRAKRGVTSTSETRATAPAPKAIDLLEKSKRPLVIDDFHYLDRGLQGSIVRALKAPVSRGFPAVLLAIPHRRYDAVRVEKEMTGRVEQISIPPWDIDELIEIPKRGFPLLNLNPDPEIARKFAEESLGSPHLMQEFCRQLCVEAGFSETVLLPTPLTPKDSVDKLLSRVASDTSKPVYERLKQGPRQRSDRMQRQFLDGSAGDIYLAVLRALTRVKPGLSKVTYEQIRTALRELLVDVPQAHEISNVLEHMSKIQAAEEASVPVLEWDKEERILHVVDPFFAFYLRWSTYAA
jgi:hypothetical protein